MDENEVGEYYKAIFKSGAFESDKFREAAISYLLPFVPAGREYLDHESWDRLALGLHVREIKLCGGCLELKPYSEFTGIAGDKCTSCRAEVKQQYDRDRHAEKTARQLRYKFRYRPKTPS